MKHLIFLMLVASLLTGCCTPQPPVERTDTVTVKVPVSTPVPEPKQVVRPQLVIYSLTERDLLDPGKVVQYYKATIKQLQGYAVELETVIDGYRKDAAKANQK